MLQCGSVKTIALDFDGVIVDSMPVQELCWKEAVGAVAPEVGIEDKILTNFHAGKAREEMFSGLQLTTIERAGLRREKDLRWHAVRSRVPLIPGVLNVLPHLSSRYRLAVASAADKVYVEAVLKRVDLLRHFSAIVTDEDVAHPKPAADIIVAIGKLTQAESQEICLVGDTFNDLQMSRNADCQFLLLKTSPVGATVQGENQCRAAKDWKEIEQYFL